MWDHPCTQEDWFHVDIVRCTGNYSPATRVNYSPRLRVRKIYLQENSTVEAKTIYIEQLKQGAECRYIAQSIRIMKTTGSCRKKMSFFSVSARKQTINGNVVWTVASYWLTRGQWKCGSQELLMACQFWNAKPLAATTGDPTQAAICQPSKW